MPRTLLDMVRAILLKLNYSVYGPPPAGEDSGSSLPASLLKDSEDLDGDDLSFNRGDDLDDADEDQLEDADELEAA